MLAQRPPLPRFCVFIIIDCLLNGFINQIYVVGAGGLIAIVPGKLRRRVAIQDSGHTLQLARSNRSMHECEPIEDQAIPSESYSEANGSDTSLVTIPQLQLAYRYQELARGLKSQGLHVEAKNAWVHALELLTDASTKHPDLADPQSRRYACANDLAWFLVNESDSEVG